MEKEAMFKNIMKKFFFFLGLDCRKRNKVNIVNTANDVKEISLTLLKDMTNKNSKLKVHLGCGPRVLKGWINIDLAYEPYENYLQYYTDKHYPEDLRGNQEDFIAYDISKGLPFDDNSVDVIFHEDFLEHIDQKSQIILLAESLRVLKKGGVHRINTPNLLESMRKNSNFTLGTKGVYEEEWDLNHHICVLTPSYLEQMASLIGYSKILFNGKNRSICEDIPIEYRPDPNDREENGNIFVDLVK